jgi:hypothetical protein
MRLYYRFQCIKVGSHVITTALEIQMYNRLFKCYISKIKKLKLLSCPLKCYDTRIYINLVVSLIYLGFLACEIVSPRLGGRMQRACHVCV